MYKYKTVNGKKIRYYVKNNNSKWTILFVHGFNSSSIFAKNLFTLKNNYNIVAIDMVDAKSLEDVEYEELIKVVNRFIRRIRTTKLIILGHSLAGGIVSKVGTNPKVRKIVYMSTITPAMQRTKGYRFLKNHHQPKNKIALMVSNKILEKSKDKYEWVHTFLDRDSKWAKILNETALDKEFMFKLDRRYKINKYKSYFIVGSDDAIINTKAYIKYVESLGKEVAIIGKRHNPIKTSPVTINNYLNDLSRGKKRFFKKGVIW